MKNIVYGLLNLREERKLASSLQYELSCYVKQCELAKEVCVDSYHAYAEESDLPFPDEDSLQTLLSKYNVDHGFYVQCMVNLTNFVLANVSHIKIDE